MSESSNLEPEIVAAIRRIIRAVDLHSRYLAVAHGLTGPQLATLREAARLGPVSASALAKAVSLSQPTMTGILDRLERRGLVSRRRDGADRRSVIITVTGKGSDILTTAPSLLQDRFRDELAKLKEWERTSMLATLQHIAAMMDAEAIEAAPILVTGPIGATPGEAERQPNAPSPTHPAAVPAANKTGQAPATSPP